MKSDEIWWKPCFHQISSELFFLVTTRPWKKKITLKIKQSPKNMHPKPNCIAAILISKLLLYSPFVFAAMGKRRLWKRQWNQPLQRGNKPLGRGIKPLPKGRTPLQRGSQPLQRGNLWKKVQSRKESWRNTTCKSWGSCPSRTKSNKSQKPMMMNMKQPRSCKRVWPQQKKAGLGPNTRPTSTRMAMRKKGMHSTMHLKMKRESWQPFSSWERKLPSSAMLAGPLAPSKRWPWQKNGYQKKKPWKMGRWFGKALLQWQGAVEAVCDNLGGLWVHGHNGLHKENHRNSQKDLDPRPGVPAEWRWIWKLEQLLGKGAALSDHGSNPWEGEREREGEQKKKAKAGAKEIPTQRHPKHLKTCHQMSSKLSASRSSKKRGICCSNAGQTMKKHLKKWKACSTSQSLPSKKRKHSFQSWKLHLEKWRNNLQKGDKGKVNITKDLLKEAVATMSEAKEEAKELVQISMKTQSKSSRKWTHGRILAKGVHFCKRWNHLCKRVGPKKGLVVCVRLSPPLQCMCEHIYTFEKGATFAKGDGKWTPITQQLFHKGWVTCF